MSTLKRTKIKAFDTTLAVYLQLKTSSGERPRAEIIVVTTNNRPFSREDGLESAPVLPHRTMLSSSDLGFAIRKMVRTCPSDFIVDVEKTSARVTKDATACERGYIRELLLGTEPADTWLALNTTVAEFKKITGSARAKVGAEFIDTGIHPYVLYKTASDMR